MQQENNRFQIFSSRLREAMKRKSLTQKQLEAISGVTQSSISAYIRGEMEPKISVFYQLSVTLDVPMEWLWGVDSDAENNTQTAPLLKAQQEITRLKAKLCSARKTLEGAYSLALEALELEEEKEDK